jgi:YkoY family integral membrane protein
VITGADAAAVAFLVFLEGILSFDNALVLALLVRGLPPPQRSRALAYGLVGAVVFRFGAVAAAAWLIHWEWAKVLGGLYLVYLPLRHWFVSAAGKGGPAEPLARSFWMTVLVVEATDILFAIDSILTAVALSPKLWVVASGGILGMLAMRVAAGFFIRLLDRFPRFEPTAYLLVLLVGAKLLYAGLEAYVALPKIDFEDTSGAACWVFWILMLGTFLSGFLPGRKRERPASL